LLNIPEISTAQKASHSHDSNKLFGVKEHNVFILAAVHLAPHREGLGPSIAQQRLTAVISGDTD
jgi:hypothetical protein